MARAAAEGHRVVLVVCTNGEHGESPDDLAPGETLVDRRRQETDRSAQRARDRPGRLARVRGLRDDRVGAERRSRLVLAGRRRRGGRSAGRRSCATSRPTSSSSTTGTATTGTRTTSRSIASDTVPPTWPARRSASRRRSTATPWRGLLAEFPFEEEFDPNGPADDGNPFGTPEAELHLAVDVSAYIERKRAALAAHASQVTDIGLMPADARRGVPAGVLHRVVHRARRPAGHAPGMVARRCGERLMARRAARPPRSGDGRLGRRSGPRARSGRPGAGPAARRSARSTSVPSRSRAARCGGAGRRRRRWPRRGAVDPDRRADRQRDPVAAGRPDG